MSANRNSFLTRQCALLAGTSRMVCFEAAISPDLTVPIVQMPANW